MTSLRQKFLLVSAISVSIILVAASVVFLYLFQRSMEDRVHDELKNYVNQVAASVEFNEDGSLKQPEGLLDPRFEAPYSGLYWQIDDQEVGIKLRSRSLWDTSLELPDDIHDVATIHKYLVPGPEGSFVMVNERTLLVAPPTGSRSIRVAAAMDQSVVSDARSTFVTGMLPYLISLGFLLVLSTIVQLYFVLRPIERVVSDLNEVQDRTKNRLDGSYPKEILPLTSAINTLLASQEKALSGARKRAGDLAHGLKTPLTVLKHNAAKLSGLETAEIGDEIADLVETMQDHVQHELVLSRLAPSPELRQSDAEIGKIIADVVRILERAPNSEALTWIQAVDSPVEIAVDPHDLRELLGNLLENALKWANSEVSISGVKNGTHYRLTIEDDGPGIDASKIEEMLDRGKRFDESVAGTGIGLSIVQSISELYNLPLKIHNRQSNGLCVIVDLPVAKSWKRGTLAD
ncbi:HAMP domain-containing sensor histidine kinase [Ahrensia sp. 13_GOM-1096m]|uniref:sensor histidine kinase n=1 Tax=Ahrensia sp. 13_GOM-1096m TaxID=1380380 RepID=UPI000479CDEF|nr:HAMP domain-containing sensor histidine kinase [Ahrensia sp. 13_GOM-1096m]